MKGAGIGGIAITSVLLVACQSTILGGTSGGGTGGAGGAKTSSSTTTTTTIATTTSSTTTTTSSTVATTSSATTSTGTCTAQCTKDADCQSSCPSAPSGSTNCCDTQTNICFLSSTPVCPPPPCYAGTMCTPGAPACTDIYGGGSCTCTCNAQGYKTCGQATPPAMCPAVHPNCGDPCTPPPATCTCSLGPGQGTTGCYCGSSGKWQCSASGPCPPLPYLSGSGYFIDNCLDFPVGLVCALPAPTWSCACEAMCGTQLWSCSGI